MNQSMSMSCRDSPINAYYNNATNTPNQALIQASTLTAFLTYAIAGAVAFVSNIICILTFMTKKNLRQKNVMLEFLAFANLFSSSYMCLSGMVRRHLIFTNQFMQLISAVECLQYPAPHLQVLGSQLPALVLLVIDIERLIAIYKPIFYKVYFTDRNRVFIAVGCCVLTFISLLIGYLSSYFTSVCTNSVCSVKNAFGIYYSNYNSAIIIIFPIVASILNIFTYMGAKRLGQNADMKKELNLILIILIITLVDVVLIAFPNIVLFCSFNNFPITSITVQQYLYIFYCCNSPINLVVYIILKRDFRNHLLMSISFGRLKPFLNVTNVIPMTGSTRRVVPRNY